MRPNFFRYQSTFKLIAVFIALAITLQSQNAVCGVHSWVRSCAVSLGLAKKPEARILPIYDVQKGIIIPERFSSQVDLIAKKYGLVGYSSAGTEVIDLISKIYLATAESKLSPSKKLDRMRELGIDLSLAFENLTRKEQSIIDFSIANAILMLDRYEPSDFVSLSKSKKFFPEKNVYVGLSFDRYLQTVYDAINNYNFYNSLFKNVQPNDEYINVVHMRDYAIYNLWPLGYAHHDIRHARFILGHPLVGALYFRAARAKNSLRFILMSMMFEAIDTNKELDELRLAKYMSFNTHFTVDEAMIYIAKASDDDLNRLVRKAGLKNLAPLIGYFKNWSPSKHGAFQGKSLSGIELDDEIDLMINKFDSYRGNPALRPFTNYVNKQIPSPVDHTEILD
jgi:hypothetical protein